MGFLTNPESLIALLTLTVLEIVLGVDNIVFVSILSGKLPKAQQAKARTMGLALAMGTRILLLISLAQMMVLVSGVWNNLRSMITGRYAIEVEGDRP